MTVRQVWLSVAVALVGAALTACASEQNFDSSQFATALAPPDPAHAAGVSEYRISANDKLSINVFPTKDFTVSSTRVDATGHILIPPVGSVAAQGKTTRELAQDIEQKLKACCLQRPQVVVLVEDTVSQQIVVTGAVVASDVYNLRGRTTLLQAITMAKGPDRATANLKRVAVYRMTNGQRTGALFNVEAIRAGKAEDPVIFGGDTIIVDTSKAKSAWRNVVSAVPFMGVFAAF